MDCRCVACLDKLPPDGDFRPHSRRQMVCCTICGNKRCPHAEDHRYACTGSNEPNQVPRLADQPQVDNAYCECACPERPWSGSEPEIPVDEPLECWPATWSEVLGLLAGGGLDDVE